MPYRAKTGDAVFDFEMPVVVPGERCDPIARRDAMTAQRIGQLPRAARRVRIAIAMDRAFDRPRDDLGAGMKAIRMLQKRRKQQRLILHQSLHGTLFLFSKEFSRRHSDAASRTS